MSFHLYLFNRFLHGVRSKIGHLPILRVLKNMYYPIPGFEFRQGKISLFSKMSRPRLGRTYIRIQWVSEFLPLL